MAGVNFPPAAGTWRRRVAREKNGFLKFRNFARTLATMAIAVRAAPNALCEGRARQSIRATLPAGVRQPRLHPL